MVYFTYHCCLNLLNVAIKRKYKFCQMTALLTVAVNNYVK